MGKWLHALALFPAYEMGGETHCFLLLLKLQELRFRFQSATGRALAGIYGLTN